MNYFSEIGEVGNVAETGAMESFTLNNIEYLQSVEGVQPYVWNRLSAEGRLETLRLLETRFAEIQGRPPVPVVMEKMEDLVQPPV